MGYFSRDDVQAQGGDDAQGQKRVQARFSELHRIIIEQIKLNNLGLSNLAPKSGAVNENTVSTVKQENILAVQYTRAEKKAVTIERMMGREGVSSRDNIIVRLHPVIELRLSQTGLALELLMSPDAWWDQENFKGKLSVSRHRQEIYTILRDLPVDYCMGFWQGIHLSDMHLKGKYFQHTRILDEWLGTFDPHADWFRLGIWYEIEDERLSEDAITGELIKQLQTLYPVYQYILWTSANNFREFATGEA